MGATGVEKTSSDDREAKETRVDNDMPKACSILDPDCEACQ
jgi:ribonucleoside-diphosphate reductase alpha chain